MKTHESVNFYFDWHLERMDLSELCTVCREALKRTCFSSARSTSPVASVCLKAYHSVH